jgi:hypothetical protein
MKRQMGFGFVQRDELGSPLRNVPNHNERIQRNTIVEPLVSIKPYFPTGRAENRNS